MDVFTVELINNSELLFAIKMSRYWCNILGFYAAAQNQSSSTKDRLLSTFVCEKTDTFDAHKLTYKDHQAVRASEMKVTLSDS